MACPGFLTVADVRGVVGAARSLCRVISTDVEDRTHELERDGRVNALPLQAHPLTAGCFQKLHDTVVRNYGGTSEAAPQRLRPALNGGG
jgi:hypothetical protein